MLGEFRHLSFLAFDGDFFVRLRTPSFDLIDEYRVQWKVGERTSGIGWHECTRRVVCASGLGVTFLGLLPLKETWPQGLSPATRDASCIGKPVSTSL